MTVKKTSHDHKYSDEYMQELRTIRNNINTTMLQNNRSSAFSIIFEKTLNEIKTDKDIELLCNLTNADAKLNQLGREMIKEAIASKKLPDFPAIQWKTCCKYLYLYQLSKKPIQVIIEKYTGEERINNIFMWIKLNPDKINETFHSRKKADTTLLEFALQENNEKLVKTLIKSGANPNIHLHDPNYPTPLLYYFRYGNYDMMKFLLKNGATPTTRLITWVDNLIREPLHYALPESFAYRVDNTLLPRIHKLLHSKVYSPTK
jgi:hypothetical protein